MTRPRLHLAAAVASLVSLALAASACGIPTSSSPTPIARSELPADLTQREVHPAPPSGNLAGGVPVKVYLIQVSTRTLCYVTRETKPPVTVQMVLDELEDGPDASDFHNGDESAVSIFSHLVAVGPVASGTATVELDSRFRQLQGEAPVDELGQIVWSIIGSLPYVHRVRFVTAIGPTPVPTDTGLYVRGPVDRNDYALAAGSVSCPVQS